MKKSSMLSLGLFTFSTILLGSTPALAAEIVNPVQANTEATVQFKISDTNPGTDIDGEEGEVDEEGSDGSVGNGHPAFNITYVSNFRFNKTTQWGTNAEGKIVPEIFAPIDLDANGMTLYAYGNRMAMSRKIANLAFNEDEEITEANAEKVKETLTYDDLQNFIQITDGRGASVGEGGWHLTVAAEDFKTAEGDILTGAELSLNDFSMKGPKPNAEATEEDRYVDLSDANYADNFSAPVLPNLNQIVIGNQATSVLNAQDQHGRGSWYLYFGEKGAEAVAKSDVENAPVVTYNQLKLVDDQPTSGVKLEVPAKASAQADKVYTSKLTWVLTAGPEA